MYIHIKSKEGMYNLEGATPSLLHITLSTKHYSFEVNILDFKCFAGGQFAPTKEELHLFYDILINCLRELGDNGKISDRIGIDKILSYIDSILDSEDYLAYLRNRSHALRQYKELEARWGF